jgi:hypothetical protein
MRHAPSALQSPHALASRDFRRAAADAIEWEELPSLVGSLGKNLAAATSNPWDATRPADLDVPVPSQPFREPVDGMAIREVLEPDVFRHFFGS